MSGAQFRRAMTLAFAPGTLWEDVAKKTAAFARSDRDAKIAAGQFPAAYETSVNGQKDAREESLRQGEVIFYQGALLGPAVAMALAELLARAPVLTGDYRRSFRVAIGRDGAGGRPISQENFRADAVSIDATEAYVFSDAPYSRILDVQIEGSRPVKVRVPPGFFSDAAGAVRRAYPTLTVERLSNIRIPWAQQRGRYTGRKIEYPAIRIGRG